MRNKPLIIKKLLEAGFNVWFLDADTSAIHEFRDQGALFSSSPISADVLLSISTDDPITPTRNVAKKLRVNAGIMFFKTNKRAISFLAKTARLLEADRSLTDQEAFQNVLDAVDVVTITGVGQVGLNDDFDTNADYDLHVKARLAKQNEKEPSALQKFFGVAIANHGELIRVHFLDSVEFCCGPLFYEHSGKLNNLLTTPKLVHSNMEGNVVDSMRSKKIWFLDDNEKCIL